MASIAALRKQAKDAGASRDAILAANTAEKLQALIDGGGNSKPKAVAKKKTATVAKKKTTGRKQDRKATVSKKSGRKSAPAKSRKSGTAKRQATAKPRSNGYVAKGGRNMIEDVDFSVTEGWNPRAGSPPDLIVKSLKKFKGNREKVFTALSANVYDFVGKKKADGSKRDKASALEMLRYRIARTAFEFATRTGQHEASQNRVRYGTGGTGTGAFKPAKRTVSRKTSTTSRKKTSGRKAAPKKGSARRKSTSRR